MGPTRAKASSRVSAVLLRRPPQIGESDRFLAAVSAPVKDRSRLRAARFRSGEVTGHIEAKLRYPRTMGLCDRFMHVATGRPILSGKAGAWPWRRSRTGTWDR